MQRDFLRLHKDFIMLSPESAASLAISSSLTWIILGIVYCQLVDYWRLHASAHRLLTRVLISSAVAFASILSVYQLYWGTTFELKHSSGSFNPAHRKLIRPLVVAYSLLLLIAQSIWAGKVSKESHSPISWVRISFSAGACMLALAATGTVSFGTFLSESSEQYHLGLIFTQISPPIATFTFLAAITPKKRGTIYTAASRNAIHRSKNRGLIPGLVFTIDLPRGKLVDGMVSSSEASDHNHSGNLKL